MAKYYYSKYNTNTTYTQGAWKSSSEGYATPAYSSYYFDSVNNSWANSGSIAAPQYDPPMDVYKVFNDGKKLVRYSYDYYGNIIANERLAQNNIANYSQGSFIETIVDEEGVYPENGRHVDGYWYIKGNLATPPINVNAGGIWKPSENTQVCINGVWRSVETIHVNVDGVWKSAV